MTMFDLKSYFEAPVYESTKTSYACRYRSTAEFELMQRLDAAQKVKSFHQPLLTALIRYAAEEKFIGVDFWIEYHSRRIDLLFIERDFIINAEAKITVLSSHKELLSPDNFGAVVLNEYNGRFRRIVPVNLKSTGTVALEEYIFVNLSWLN